MANDTLIKKIAFRLVKKHIAGFTTESALNAVRSVNMRGMHATITFLNEHTGDQIKARYNSNTYMQILKQISRLHLNADLSIRLSQLGYGVGEEYAKQNLSEILNAAEKSKKFIWIENEEGIQAARIYSELKRDYDCIGLETQITNNSLRRDYNVKIKYHLEEMLSKDGKKVSSALREYAHELSHLTNRVESVTVFEKNPKIISKLLNLHLGKRNLIFELPLGYENKVAKNNSQVKNMSVYVPYGKDWVPYIISNIAKGRLKRVATALFDGEDRRGYKNAS
ncbi:MAG: hypothetical protein ACP5TL_02930 [Candidatus Micrarchaeia archaeon]